MTRDWDVIRDLLTQIEGLSSSERQQLTIGVGRDEKDEKKRDFVAHAFLLRDAGFITGGNSTTFSGRSLVSPDLTWEGHDLLATLRSKPVWERIKSTAQEKGIELTVDAVKALGKLALDWVVKS